MHPAHIRTARQWVAEWLALEAHPPFENFLKVRFRDFKKAGSRDRREIREACYEIFRVLPGVKEAPDDEQLQQYVLQKRVLADGDSQSAEGLTARLNELVSNLFPAWNWSNYFPASEEISRQIAQAEFAKSHLIQPYTWLRISKGYGGQVQDFIKSKANIRLIAAVGMETLAVPPGVNLSILNEAFAGKWEVQDYASQQTAAFFNLSSGDKVWDVSAGSGGKTLLIEDHFPHCHFYASDTRPSILENFKARREAAGLKPLPLVILPTNPQVLTQLEFEGQKIPQGFFDCLVIDAPCSGSGTWGRNPERLSIFNPNEIAHYASLQLSIVKMAIPYLKSGGQLIYITCSVYEAENEGHMEDFKALGMELKRHSYLYESMETSDVIFCSEMNFN